MKYKLIIGKISTCHGISIKIIMLQDAVRYLPNMISTNPICMYSAKYEIKTECQCIPMWNSTHFIWKKINTVVFITCFIP